MGSNEEFLAGGDTEFVEDVGQVMTNRDHGDAQAACNVFVGKALSDQGNNLAFPLRQGSIPMRAG